MRRTRVVLDTNVVVSAHLNSGGYERFVLDLALASKLALYVSPEILVEYEGVLQRKKFSFDSLKISRSLALLRAKAKTVKPKHAVSAALDPDDNKFLACAVEAKADFLVTGNKRHFPQVWKGTSVVNAKELVLLISTSLEQ